MGADGQKREITDFKKFDSQDNCCLLRSKTVLSVLHFPRCYDTQLRDLSLWLMPRPYLPQCPRICGGQGGAQMALSGLDAREDLNTGGRCTEEGGRQSLTSLLTSFLRVSLWMAFAGTFGSVSSKGQGTLGHCQAGSLLGALRTLHSPCWPRAPTSAVS